MFLIMNDTGDSYMLFALSLFTRLILFVLFLYIIGVINSRPPYLLQINYVLKVFLSFFLLYRFNGFRKESININRLDQKIIVSISLYVLVLSFVDLLLYWIEEIRSFILKHKSKLYGFLSNKIIVPYQY